jgi:hypothetical protein
MAGLPARNGRYSLGIVDPIFLENNSSGKYPFMATIGSKVSSVYSAACSTVWPARET